MLYKLLWDILLNNITEYDTIEIIINKFNSQPEEMKLHIIRNSINILDEKLAMFYKNIIYEQPLMVKLEILKYLFKNYFDMVLEFMDSPDEDIKTAYKEVICMYN